MKALTKETYHTLLNQASKLVGSNPAISDGEVCEILKISRKGYTKIKQDREFHEKMEAHFEKNITKDLLLVDVAMIREAQGGNVQAARYLAERHGKFVKKYQIEVKSPYELFAKEVETADYEELTDSEELTVTRSELPPRDIINDKPRTRANNEQAQIRKRIHKITKEISPQHKADKADRLQLRKRAEAGGLPLMGRAKPDPHKRKQWLNTLLQLEEEKRKTLTAD